MQKINFKYTTKNGIFLGQPITITESLALAFHDKEIELTIDDENLPKTNEITDGNVLEKVNH